MMPCRVMDHRNFGLGNGLLPDGSRPLNEPTSGAVMHKLRFLVLVWQKLSVLSLFSIHDLGEIQCRSDPNLILKMPTDGVY